MPSQSDPTTRGFIAQLPTTSHSLPLSSSSSPSSFLSSAHPPTQPPCLVYLLFRASNPSLAGLPRSRRRASIERSERDILAQEVKELKAALAAKDEKNKVLAAENDDMRRKLAAATAETEALESNAQEQAPKMTEDNVQDSSTWHSTASIECV